MFRKVNNISIVSFLPGTVHVFCSKAKAVDKFMAVERILQPWMVFKSASLLIHAPLFAAEFIENEPRQIFPALSTTIPPLNLFKLPFANLEKGSF